MRRFLLPLLIFCFFVFGAHKQAQAQFPNVYGLTEQVAGTQQLVRWPLLSPALAGSINITGIVAGDRLIGIDFRPSSTVLYAVGMNWVYTLNPGTGVATPVAPLSTPLTGFFSGVAFDPNFPNRIRVNGLTGGNRNLLIHSATGTVTPFPNLFYVPASPQTPIISGTAYNSDFAFFPARWYGINPRNATLLREQNINAGSVVTVGSLGFVTLNPEIVGFDIYQIPGTTLTIGFATFAPGGVFVSSYYAVNLTNGATFPFGTVGSGYPITSITIR